MQRMHQSYKYMKAQQKKLSGVHPTCLLTKTQGTFEEAKPSSIMKSSHQYMKVTTYETLYHEDHGAILKQKCGKRDSSIVPSLFFSHFIFFLLPFFLFGLSLFLFFCFSFCKVRSLIPTCGGIIVFIILSLLGQCSNNEDHHTLMDLQLKNYNSILRTKYAM